MNGKSYQYKNEIKEKLSVISNTIDDMYYTLEGELRSEIKKKQDKKETLHKEADEMFEKLDYTICNRILKSKLPLRVKLFNNIECMGYGVTPDNQIEIEFAFNDRFGERYHIELGLQEMKEYIK